MKRRLQIIIGTFFCAIALLYLLNRPVIALPHRPLMQLPNAFGEWQGTDLPITQRILNIAGVTDYVNRKYENRYGAKSYVYIGYYGSQRAGEQIHSPRNCLPGAGWEILRTRRLQISVPDQGPMVVNDFLASNGLETDLILYWYQTRGRVIQSEYVAKFWMLADALTKHRTDGALVRIAIPLQGSEAEARSWGVFLIQALHRNLQEFIPN